MKKDKYLCNDILSSCFCHEDKGHDGLHKCRCGGSWDKEKNIHSFPDISLGFGAFPLTDFERDILSNQTLTPEK